MDSANGSAAALDATVRAGDSSQPSRLLRATAAWEFTVDQTARMRRKVAKMEPQLADARRALAEAEQAEAEAQAELDAAKVEVTS